MKCVLVRGEYTVYCGQLPPDIRARELDDLFGRYGRIRDIDVKPSRGGAFAFIEFEDDRDADEAAYRLDNFRFDGRPLRVELKRGGGRRGPGGAYDDPRDRDRDSGRGGGGGYGMSRDERRERDRAGGARATVAAAKRTPWTARLLGLPVSTSWQDVKDFVRQVAPAKFANVFKEGGEVIGEADFESEADLDNIISRLDGADFKNPFDTVKVTVERVKPSAPAPRADEGEDKRRREDDMDAEDTRRREDDVDAEEAIEDAAAKEEEKPAVEEEAPQEEPAEEAAAPADE